MNRYGFAVKALPEGDKPFGQKDDENEEVPGLETSSPGASESDTSPDPADELPEDPTAAPFAPAEAPQRHWRALQEPAQDSKTLHSALRPAAHCPPPVTCPLLTCEP